MPARRQYYEKDGILYLQCKGCGEYKSPDNFYKHKICFMGLSSICKDCNHKHGAEYYSENKDEVNKKNRGRREKNKDIRNTEKREKYKNDSEYRKLCSEKSKIWREENKEANLKHHKEYYEQNKEIIAERGKQYYTRNKDYILDRSKRYNETHRTEINKNKSEYKKAHRDMMNKYQQGLRERRGSIYSKAHRLVEKRLKEIGLKRERCPMCLQEGLVVCHHPDYNQPYEVVPCCNLCHSQIHRGIIECPKPIDLLKI